MGEKQRTENPKLEGKDVQRHSSDEAWAVSRDSARSGLSRRKFLKLGGTGIAGLSMLGVTACGGNGGGNSGNSGSKSFTYWSMWQKGEPQQKVLQEAITDFQNDTGITVNVQWQGRGVVKKLVPALNTSSNVPDLVDQGSDVVYSILGKSDKLADLSGVYDRKIPGEDQKVSEVIPSSVADTLQTEDGKPFMLPYEIVGQALWFNANALPNVAKQPPKTWQAFSSLLEQRKAEAGPPLALDSSLGNYITMWTSWPMVRVLGPGNFLKTASDKTAEAWDDPGVLKAAKIVEQLVDNNMFLPTTFSTKWPAEQRKWAAGDADFLLMGSWAPSETSPYAKSGFEYDSFQFPDIEGGKGNEVFMLRPFGFAIPKKAKNSEPAEQFMAYFLNKQRLQGIAKVAKNLTPRLDIAVPPELQSLYESYRDSRGHFRPRFDGVPRQLPDWYNKIWINKSRAFVSGKLSAEQFIEQVKGESVKFWGGSG